MDPHDFRAWRRATRERLIAERMVLPSDEHRAKSRAISDHLLARIAASSFASLGCYWPFRNEFDCLPAMQTMLAAGGLVALPVVIATKKPLEFRPWTPETRMETGPWDVPHPAEGPPVRPEALLIPLVGFDAAGFRLGYGGGYYDRTIAAFEQTPLTIGVGFEFGRLPTIHPHSHDVPMDVIITEAGVRERAAG